MKKQATSTSYELIPGRKDQPDEEQDDSLPSARKYRSSTDYSGVYSFLRFLWKRTLGRIGEDWIFLSVLGIIMAIVSFVMDYGIAMCNLARIWLSGELIINPFLQYLGWVFLPVCLILFSTIFTSLVAPQAAGSGIPEMKTILRGVFLKDSLSVKALVTKIIGLTATLGTGLPLGKEGPFVHIASMVALLMTKVFSSFSGIYTNKARNYDMLASSCAVGVAAAFAAPIGGVLFSIEVTAVYFAVRNYWRGFFAAVCGAVMFRMMAVWVHDEETISALFKTNFDVDVPFAPGEIIVFALLGVLSGLLGALFIWVHRKYSLFLKRNRIMKAINKRSRLIYPFMVTLLYSTLTFPLGLGQFVAGELTTHEQVTGMFSNFSWINDDLTVSQYNVASEWTTPWTGIFVNLLFYAVFTFFGTILACTVPVPAGIFVPVFKIGAALGRIVGECMVVIFPDGILLGSSSSGIMPGGYAIVGAAALVGAVTHTVSTSVIAFELTGQITHSIPIMIAVLVSNAVAQGLQPSIFDSIIQMKKLPYLPDIMTSIPEAYDIFVEDFMIREVKFIWYGIKFSELKAILLENIRLRTFPLVDSASSMVLLGSIRQKDLFSLLEGHLGRERKIQFFREWNQMATSELEKDLAEEEREKKLRTSSSLLLKSEEKTAKPFFTMDNTSTNEAIEKEGNTKVIAIEEPESTKSESQTLPTSGSPVIKDSILQRRPSRFSVTKVEDPIGQIYSPPDRPPFPPPVADPLLIETADSNSHLQTSELPSSANTTITFGTPRPKSILKKTRSFVFQPLSPTIKSFSSDHYATVNLAESGKLRQAFSSLKRARSFVGMENKSSSLTFSGVSRADLPTDRLIAKIHDQELKWEVIELDEVVDFSKCRVDPSPHQLVERTNLMKVHFLFSMLNLNHAYVTAIGRLIGVVSLTVLREAIEDINAGDFIKEEVKEDEKIS